MRIETIISPRLRRHPNNGLELEDIIWSMVEKWSVVGKTAKYWSRVGPRATLSSRIEKAAKYWSRVEKQPNIFSRVETTAKYWVALGKQTNNGIGLSRLEDITLEMRRQKNLCLALVFRR